MLTIILFNDAGTSNKKEEDRFVNADFIYLKQKKIGKETKLV